MRAATPVFGEGEDVDIVWKRWSSVCSFGVDHALQFFIGHAASDDLCSVGQSLGLSEGLSKATFRAGLSFAVFLPGRVEAGRGGQADTEENVGSIVSICHEYNYSTILLLLM